jgi:hypothetical protein
VACIVSWTVIVKIEGSSAGVSEGKLRGLFWTPGESLGGFARREGVVRGELMIRNLGAFGDMVDG